MIYTYIKMQPPATVHMEGQQHKGVSGGLGFMLSCQRQKFIYFLLQRQNYSNLFLPCSLISTCAI